MKESIKIAAENLVSLAKKIEAKEDLGRAPREDLKVRYKEKRIKDKDFKRDCKDTIADPDLAKD